MSDPTPPALLAMNADEWTDAVNRIVGTLNREGRMVIYRLRKEIDAQAARVAEQQATIERLTKTLADCYRATGEDPDGNEDWRLAEHALSAVKRARADWEREADAYDEQIIQLRSEGEPRRPEPR